MKTLGFIGMGNMGQAMLKGCLNVFKAEELVFTALLEEECRAVSEKTGVGYVMDAAACAADVKYLVLAIKPQVYPEILKTLSGKIRRDQIVISIAPSYSIAQVKEGLGGEVRVVRAMPNTPAMVGEGMSGVCFSGDIYSDEEKQMVQTFFSSFGKMEIVPEHLINAVTVASGSSPAFVYMFIEALADGGVKNGLPRAKAQRYAAQMLLGSAEMALRTGRHPGQLKDEVCSPGGSTIAGVAALERSGFRSACIEAVDAAVEKTRQLG